MRPNQTTAASKCRRQAKLVSTLAEGALAQSAALRQEVVALRATTTAEVMDMQGSMVQHMKAIMQHVAVAAQHSADRAAGEVTRLKAALQRCITRAEHAEADVATARQAHATDWQSHRQEVAKMRAEFDEALQAQVHCCMSLPTR